MSAVPWWRRLTPRHVVLLAPWVGLVIGAAGPILDNSLLWHVRAGTVQLDLGHVLRSDPFSFTMLGEPWRTQSWLMELGYGLLERWTGGLGWVPVLVLVVGSLTFALVALGVHRQTRSLLATGIVMALFTWLGLAFQVPRPVLVSFLLLAMLIAVLDRGVLWAVPLILWVWSSLHGSWVLGLGYIVLEALASCRSWKLLVKTSVASLVAVSLTAHGLGVWEILWAFFRNRGALRLISEWAVPDILSVPNLPYALGVGALLLAATKRRIETRQLWVIVPFLIFGLTSGRSLFPAAIVLVPLEASALRARGVTHLKVPRWTEATANAVIAAVLLLVPLAALGPMSGELDRSLFPVEAASYLGDGNTWADDGTGGYLIYSDWPKHLVYIDDRAELFGERLAKELVQVRAGQPQSLRVFQQRNIMQALVQRGSGISTVLERAGWGRSFEDSAWVLWVRPTRE